MFRQVEPRELRAVDVVGVPRRYRLLAPTLPFLAFLYFFYKLGSLLPVPRNIFFPWKTPPRSLTEECVLRIGAMGATLMAVLSGFGSICAGWEMYLTPTRFGPSTHLWLM